MFNPGRRNQALREQWGLANDDIALLYVGRLAAEKNLGVLQHCLRAVRQQNPQRRIKLIVVGDGPQRSALQQQLPDAVFCGAHRDQALAEHYASGDIFLFPSLTETFGNVVLEALASGLGVVAYDQAAAGQHIRHGHSALAMPGDTEAFIDACNWLVEDTEALRRVRLNARQHASRQGWPAIIEQFEHHLREACHPPQQHNTAPQTATLAIKPESSAPRG
ncbi:GDP-mannose-dependent alpha-mannosyltransferase [compost metagenome]